LMPSTRFESVPGSQDFEVRTDVALSLTASIRHPRRRYPQHSQVLCEWRVSAASRFNLGGSKVNASP
jgi:hypothetical protein